MPLRRSLTHFSNRNAIPLRKLLLFNLSGIFAAVPNRNVPFAAHWGPNRHQNNLVGSTGSSTECEIIQAFEHWRWGVEGSWDNVEEK
jgi:hypothetical protein